MTNHRSLKIPDMPIIKQRMTAAVEGDFCVFVIGMRVNSWWRVHKWWPVVLAMPRMIKELKAAPESGFLGSEQAFGNPTIMIQYWRSFEQLDAYAKNPSQAHLPAWKAFNRAVAGNGSVGIWHETYLVRAGEYESIYNNMPPFGLGKATKAVPIAAKYDSARDRVEARVE